MPLTPEDQLRVEEAEREAQAAGNAKYLSKNPTESQKLSPFSVACTVWNRCIGRTPLRMLLVDALDHD